MGKGSVSVETGDGDSSKCGLQEMTSGVSFWDRCPSIHNLGEGLACLPHSPPRDSHGTKSIKGDGTVWTTQTKPSKHAMVPTKSQKCSNTLRGMKFY